VPFLFFCYETFTTLANWHTHLPDWLQEWLDVMVPLLQIVLIVFCAWLLHRLVRRVLSRASTHYQLPHELLMPINVVVRWLIVSGAVLLALERLGVSATVLWSAFTGFATVGAVAFFAAWSVLSNLFCAFLIFTAARLWWATRLSCWTTRKARCPGQGGGHQPALHHLGGHIGGQCRGTGANPQRLDLSARAAPLAGR